MKYILKNANILDGTKDMELKENYSILINENIIEKIDKNINEDNIKVYDLKGKYVIPGLINLHSHIPCGGKVSKKKKDLKKLVSFIINSKLGNKIGLMMEKKYAQQALKSGTTTIRTVGGLGHLDSDLRNKINNGKTIGPRIFTSDYAITVEGGHMLGTVAVAVHSDEEIKERIDDLKNHNVDFIKIMITGGILDCVKRGEPGILRMQPEIVKKICDYAHSKGLYVSAHVESTEGVKVAIENGVDHIEHGSEFDDEIVKLFKEKNAVLDATLSPAVPEALVSRDIIYISEIAQYNAIVLTDNVILGAKKALKEGIKLGLGTDAGCPFVEHYNFYRELEWAHSLLELDRKYCLYLGTLNNAEILKQDKYIGSIEENKFADLVVLNDNPLNTFLNIKNPSMVIKDGKIIKNLKIKKNPIEERELDNLQYVTSDEIHNLVVNLK